MPKLNTLKVLNAVGKPAGKSKRYAKMAKNAQRVGKPAGKAAIQLKKAKKAQRTEKKSTSIFDS